MSDPDDHETHWHDQCGERLRSRVFGIGLALFALAGFGGVWAVGGERGWW